jgi:hypothetical protein
MATLLFMRQATVSLKVGATAAVQYQGQVSTAAVEVEAGDVVTYPVLDGTVPSNVGPESYALHLVAAQDWTAASGLARFLWDQAGQDATFYLSAYGAGAAPAVGKPAVSGTVRLVAPTYGGEVNTYAELDVTLPCLAKPLLAETGTIPSAMEDAEEAALGAPEEAPAKATSK